MKTTGHEGRDKKKNEWNSERKQNIPHFAEEENFILKSLLGSDVSRSLTRIKKIVLVKK